MLGLVFTVELVVFLQKKISLSLFLQPHGRESNVSQLRKEQREKI
jgi:hypothetical protein